MKNQCSGKQRLCVHILVFNVGDLVQNPIFQLLSHRQWKKNFYYESVIVLSNQKIIDKKSKILNSKQIKKVWSP